MQTAAELGVCSPGRDRAQLDPGANQGRLGAAKTRGRKGGRKPALTEKTVKEIKQLLKDPDIEATEMAKRYGISRASIYKHLRATESVNCERTIAAKITFRAKLIS